MALMKSAPCAICLATKEGTSVVLSIRRLSKVGPTILACSLPGEVAKNEAMTRDVSPVWLVSDAQNSGTGQKALTAVGIPHRVMLTSLETLTGCAWEALRRGR